MFDDGAYSVDLTFTLSNGEEICIPLKPYQLKAIVAILGIRFKDEHKVVMLDEESVERFVEQIYPTIDMLLGDVDAAKAIARDCEARVYEND